jgi:hypothetical protein
VVEHAAVVVDVSALVVEFASSVVELASAVVHDSTGDRAARCAIDARVSRNDPLLCTPNTGAIALPTAERNARFGPIVHTSADVLSIGSLRCVLVAGRSGARAGKSGTSLSAGAGWIAALWSSRGA